ncbi:protein kinase domain-containing protein [Aquipuribacter hungaricus]|uniref:non-specific serine/threonine protein kinase n=3 Tax=Aquipuribacter hungaricus TaxID=545624 RepID=A0ABV7WKZ8_9MICO
MTPDDAGLPRDRTPDPAPRPDAGGHGPGHLVGGRYELVRSLGRGGMGVVWQARDITLDRAVAVKEVTFPPGLDERQRTLLRERTLREARAAARIRSDAAVTVYDVVEEDGRPWIVMELLPARSLADVVREEGPLDAGAAARVGLRLLDALEAAHAAGVLHRDVKPANVLVDGAGRAVLTDFGIASLEGDSSLTTTGTVVGSPGYVAPERGLGRPPSAASDLWSLGVTLAAAVHGRPPFEKDTPLATMVSAMQDPLPEAVVTGPLGEVVARLLEKDPARRPDVATTRSLLLAAAAAPAGPRTGTATTTVLPAAAGGLMPPTAERTQALPHVPAGTGRAAGAPRAPRAPRPGGAPDRPARRSRLLPLLLFVVAAVVAAMVAAVVLDRRDSTSVAGGPTAPASQPAADGTATAETGGAAGRVAGGGADEPSTAAPSAPGEPTAAATDAADAGAGVAPEGFTLHEDPAYRVAVPEGWTVEADGESRTYFRDPGSRRYLLVDEGGEPAGDPVEDWERQEASVSEAGRFPGYELLGIERADFRGFDAADWQFRWQAENGPLRVLNRAVVDQEAGQAYALYWSVPDEEWDDARPVFDSIAGSFQPVG